MRQAWVLMIFILGVILAFDSGAAAFCVQSYNAYGPAYARNTIKRTQRMTERLDQMEPCEILHFQEVWSEEQADVFLKQLDRFQKISSPNLKHRIGLMGFYEGDSLGSKTYFFPLNNDGGVVDGIREAFSVLKGFQVERIHLKSTREPIYFLNTHLHPTSEGVRLAQILELYQWRRQNFQDKIILSGDFNFEADSLERRVLMGLMGSADSGEEVFGSYVGSICTYCEENPLRWLDGDHVFDYIFYSNSGGNTGVRLLPQKGEINFKEQKTGEFLSDHYGVRVHFDWIAQTSSAGFDELKYRRFLQDLFVMNKVLKNQPDYFFKYQKMTEEIYKSLKEKKGAAWEFYRAGV